MKLQSIQSAPSLAMLKAPQASSMTFGMSAQSMMTLNDSFVRQAPPTVATQKAQHTGLRFGGCVCPICASIGLIDAAYSKVQAIESGQTVPMGSALSSIADQTGFDYITHEDGTRLLPPANSDLERVKRVFAQRTVDDSTYPPGIQLDLSTMTPLSKWAYAAFARREQELDELPTYGQHNPILPLKSDVMPAKPDKDERYLLSIVHQMFPENQRETQPVSMGALLVQHVLTRNAQKNEITVLASREYPTMEQMNIAPAGITNMLALQALKQWGDFDTVGIFTSAEQHDVHDYLAHLKSLGIPVKRYASPAQAAAKPTEFVAMPDDYNVIDQDAYGLEAQVYQVDVRPLREWAKKGLPDSVRDALLQRDPALADKLKLGERKPLNEQELLAVLRVPPADGARVFRSGLEEHASSGHDHGHDHDDHGHVHGPGCGCSSHAHRPLIQLSSQRPQAVPQVMTARRVKPDESTPKLKITFGLPTVTGEQPQPEQQTPGKLKLSFTPPKTDDPPQT